MATNTYSTFLITLDVKSYFMISRSLTYNLFQNRNRIKLHSIYLLSEGRPWLQPTSSDDVTSGHQGLDERMNDGPITREQTHDESCDWLVKGRLNAVNLDYDLVKIYISYSTLLKEN